MAGTELKTKRCSKCKIEKPVCEFWKNVCRPDGYQSQCKQCHYTSVTAQLEGPNRERYLRMRQNGHYRRKHGITLEEVEQRIADQEGKCAICGRVRPLVLDHNHETRELRDMLCDPCNIAIGYLDEDPALFDRAVEYLKKWSG